jgi:Zn-dependent protease
MYGRGFKLFNLMGFEVRLHSSWLILGALVVWSLGGGFFRYRFPGYSQADYWWMAIGGAIGLLFSIVIHEFAHSVVARHYGIPMRGITLFIFGGVAEMGDEPPSAKSEFLMAIAGPLTSFVIAACSFGLAAILNTGTAPGIGPVFAYLAWINGLLGLFNLIPAFPLDGGRVLRAAIWAKKRDLVSATRIASWIGSAFGILLMLLGAWTIFQGNMVGGVWWILIGMFVRNASNMSYRQVVYRRAMQERHMQELLDAEQAEPYIDVEPVRDSEEHEPHGANR